MRDLLESTATPFRVVAYEPRATIFQQGDRCDSVMHIESGRVWLAVRAPSGKEAICSLAGTGAFVGEEALTGCDERRQSATAMMATQVVVVPVAPMTRLLRTQPGLLERFVAHLLARNLRLEDSLTEQLLYSSEQRLAHLLLVLANCDPRRPRRCALPVLPQEIIAEMVGTTRARVNAFMGKFKELGFVEENRGVRHVNPARLHVVDARDHLAKRRQITRDHLTPVRGAARFANEARP
ncbi:MAG: Crp/Fnr family transcriptional regulator [Acidobacteriota bacterium]|nr:Crp/Fnr family transcriptional regulator [Acidobacteriota bacterium]